MVDRYTKAVLTVIAACLVWIVARDVQLVPEARAQAFGSDGTVDVNIVSVGGIDVFGTIPVREQ